MRRRTARPFGQSTSYARLVSMLMALVVIGFFYNRLKDPTIWRFITDDPLQAQEPDIQKQIAEEQPETLVPGPNDLDDESADEMRHLLDFVVDRAPLKTREMHAYWKLIDWSRTQPIRELERRAKANIPFKDFWEQPNQYRGELIRLRLHVRRVLQYDAPVNPSNIKTVYEAWGWTDDSLSFPYVIVFPEAPTGLPIGQDVRTEVVFTGYFLKIMTYTAFDHPRGAPLLVGRVRLIQTNEGIAAPTPRFSNALLPIIGCGSILAIGAAFVVARRHKQKVQRASLPDSLSSSSSFAFDPADEETHSSGGINFDFLNEPPASSPSRDRSSSEERSE